MTYNDNVQKGILQHLEQEKVAQKELVSIIENSTSMLYDLKESKEKEDQINSSSVKESKNYQQEVEDKCS
jgi:hypothetical protein